MSTDNFESNPSTSTVQGSASGSGTEPLACVSCRARKLKCDRIKPACSRCIKVSNDCVYPESRRKPTFKRRNVKELEARLAQVEDYLKDVKNVSDKVDDTSPVEPVGPHWDFTEQNGLPHLDHSSGDVPEYPPQPFSIPDITPPHGPAASFFGDTQLIELGMSESVPPMDVMEELNNAFFKDQHYYVPIVHPGRYFQAFYGNSHMKPPMCLQYAIWALAALGHAKYDKFHEIFYHRARKYLEADEMKGDGEHFITINHAQAWGLVSSYEAKRMLFTRSTMSSARCVRLCHMMCLDRIDGDDFGSPPSLGPPLTWAELEERRRVFWGAFCFDAHASISTGWASLINTEDISTRLPAPEDNFLADQKVESPFLQEIFQGATYHGFAGMVVVCQIFKIILRHVHGAKPTDQPDNYMHGAYWKQHRELDNTLSSVFMFLPEKLRLPQNLREPTATHINLNLHASVICLHHAAVEKVEMYKLPESLKQTSIVRLRAAAGEIVNVLKLASHTTAIFKSPLCAVSMYCATTVYVYLAKQDPVAGLTVVDIANLEMILQRMEAIARTHNITRAFLQQAYTDIENNGLSSCIRMPTLNKYHNAFGDPTELRLMRGRFDSVKHTDTDTDISPVLPGLPLKRGSRSGPVCPGNPRGRLIGSDCFKAVLGAVTRNVVPRGRVDVPTNKRKRSSHSPGPDMTTDFGGGATSNANTPSLGKGTVQGGAMVLWPLSNQMHSGNIILPDRTTPSSSSSPANHGSDSRTATGSSHTSPCVGLGNSMEENRIDLRVFQDRISTPIWQATEETFFTQISESMVNVLPGDGDAWGILDTDINWDNMNNVG